MSNTLLEENFNPELIDDCYANKNNTCEGSCSSSDKDCKCYRQLIDDAMNYDDVFCAFEDDGFLYACDEACCNGGKGCVEPVRCLADAEYLDSVDEAEQCDAGIVSQTITNFEDDTVTENQTTRPVVKSSDWLAIVIGIIFAIMGMVLLVRRPRGTGA